MQLEEGPAVMKNRKLAERQSVHFVMKIAAVGLIVCVEQRNPISEGRPQNEIGAQCLA